MVWSKQSGEIFSMYFCNTLVVVFNSYDILKDTLVKRADIISERPKNGLLSILPQANRIVEASGALRRENRSTVLSILREFGMGKNLMALKIEEEVQAYLSEIERLDRKPTDLKGLNAVSNVILSVILGN